MDNPETVIRLSKKRQEAILLDWVRSRYSLPQGEEIEARWEGEEFVVEAKERTTPKDSYTHFSRGIDP